MAPLLSVGVGCRQKFLTHTKGQTMNIIIALFIAVAFVYGLYQLTIGDDDE